MKTILYYFCNFAAKYHSPKSVRLKAERSWDAARATDGDMVYVAPSAFQNKTMEYKKLYSEEELNGLMDWFKEHMDQLPQSLYIDKATYVVDLKQTVLYYFDIINLLKENPTYSAQIRHLFLMKEAVEKVWNEGIVKPED